MGNSASTGFVPAERPTETPVSLDPAFLAQLDALHLTEADASFPRTRVCTLRGEPTEACLSAGDHMMVAMREIGRAHV